MLKQIKPFSLLLFFASSLLALTVVESAEARCWKNRWGWKICNFEKPEADRKANSLVASVLAQTSNQTNWQLMPGSAQDVGDGWIIGTNPETYGYSIYRWNGSNWDKVEGSAVRIGGNPQNPWVVNNQNQIYRWNGSSWQSMPGSAQDVGDGWIIGTEPETYGYGIYRWNGSNWDKVEGSAVVIGGNRQNPWVVSNQAQIYRR